MSKKPLISSTMRSNGRVLNSRLPDLAEMVLPCMGSHDHTTVLPGLLHSLDQGGSDARTLSDPNRQISVSRPASSAGIELVDQLDQLSRLERRPALEADRIGDAAAELDAGVIEAACAIADPDHVRRGIEPVAGAKQRVLPGQRLLVAAAAAPRGWSRSPCDGWRASSPECRRTAPAPRRHRPDVRRFARYSATTGLFSNASTHLRALVRLA